MSFPVLALCAEAAEAVVQQHLFRLREGSFELRPTTTLSGSVFVEPDGPADSVVLGFQVRNAVLGETS